MEAAAAVRTDTGTYPLDFLVGRLLLDPEHLVVPTARASGNATATSSSNASGHVAELNPPPSPHTAQTAFPPATLLPLHHLPNPPPPPQ